MSLAAARKFLEVSQPGVTDEMTAAQRVKVIQVIDHQGVENLQSVNTPTSFAPWVGLQFKHIYIGVERDGHAHS